jgi:cytochrome P450
LSATLSEVFRTLPTVGVKIIRKIVKPFSLCGVNLRKGDTVGLFPVTSLSREDVYPNVTKFDPNRFLKDATADIDGNDITYPKIPRHSFMPFSTGGRNCIGQYLGEMMVKIVVTEFLREFKFDVISEDWKPIMNMAPIYTVTNCDLIISIRN